MVSRTKDSKSRTGKSYLEERQRQAERREEQRKKNSHSSISVTDTKSSNEDKTVIDEEGIVEEKPSESGSKLKESDFKRTERTFKRDEGRGNSYKYESRREREGEDVRRSRRPNDRGYQNSRRDDDRPEDIGRKRYSETRRSHDSPRERYKDKDKPKVFNLKKTSESTSEIDSVNTTTDKLIQPDIDGVRINDDTGESNLKEADSEVLGDDKANLSVNNNIPIIEKKVSSEFGKRKQFETKDKVNPTRRKSFDYDKNRQQSSYNSNRSNNKEKFSEKKRRNSFGSSKNQDSLDATTKYMKNITDTEPKELVVETSTEQQQEKVSEFKKQIPQNKEILATEESVKNEFEIKDKSVPKRRNSTGERHSLDKLSSRRNSLGSEDKNIICSFDNEEQNCDSSVIPESGKNKDEKKHHRNSRDPRTERRIRNKVSKHIFIYTNI